ncbi:BolA domain UV induced protein Uvi31, partial [Cryomyces antarcticus]
MAQSMTPMEDAMRAKLTTALNPSTLEIHNDSHMHSHHKAMQGVQSKETHFRYTQLCSLLRIHAFSPSVVITSDAFKGKMQPARHRIVYNLLKEELAAAGGIHALQLRTRTSEEEER